MKARIAVFLYLGLLMSLLMAAAARRAAGSGVQGGLATAITYQGYLTDGGAPAAGSYDFRFRLYNAAAGGGQIGDQVPVDAVSITDGQFTVQLDFGAVFDGLALPYLEIDVRPAGGTYSTLSPRQPLTPAPLALYSASADWNGLQGVPAGFADGVDDDTTYLAGNGLGLAGNVLNVVGSAYDNVIIVAQSGGDFSGIQTALDSIVDAGPENPYLVWVAPGVYTETVELKSYVTVQGAGRAATRITSPGFAALTTGTVEGADNAVLRGLTVENTGNANMAVAIMNSSVSPILYDLDVVAGGAALQTYGIYNANSAAQMSEMKIIVTGGSTTCGVRNFLGGPVEMRALTIETSNAQTGYGVCNTTATVSMAELDITVSGGSTANSGLQNSSSTSTLLNSTIFVTGVGDYGIQNDSSSLILTNVTVSSAGDASNTAILNENNGTLEIIASQILATSGGGFFNYAVYNDSSWLKVRNSILEADVGDENYSVYNVANSGTYTVDITGSRLVGEVRDDSEFATTCTNSHFRAGVLRNEDCYRQDNSGIVRAAVYAFCSSSAAAITRSANNVNYTTITVADGAAVGKCVIDFGFDISGAYWLAMSVYSGNRGVNCLLGATNSQLICSRFVSTTGTGAAGDIMVLVY